MQLVSAKLCRLSTGIGDILFVSARDTKKPWNKESLAKDAEKAALPLNSWGDRLGF